LKCPNCGLVNPENAQRCDCGHDFTSSQLEEVDADRGPSTGKVSLAFEGGALKLAGRGLIAVVLSALIIPAAWGAVFLFRWVVENLSLSDGTKASFVGRGKDIWGYFVIVALAGAVPQVLSGVFRDNSGTEVLVLWGAILLLTPVTVAVYLKIFHWLLSNIKLSCGTNLSFEGRFGAYLGWVVLLYVSLFTIVGWA